MLKPSKYVAGSLTATAAVVKKAVCLCMCRYVSLSGLSGLIPARMLCVCECVSVCLCVYVLGPELSEWSKQSMSSTFNQNINVIFSGL